MSTARFKLTLPTLRFIGSIGMRMVFSLGFWSSIVLPLVYVPLLLVGHPWMMDITHFSQIVAVHLVSIVIGNDHGRA